MRAHARSLRSSCFNICSIRQRRDDDDDRGDGHFHFQTDGRVGRDLSTLVTQGHPLHGALRDGDRGCANPREDPPDPEDMPCNPIVPLKGLGQTAGDAVAAHASIRL